MYVQEAVVIWMGGKATSGKFTLVSVEPLSE